MLNIRLAGDHQYGKLLFTWLSLVISLMVSFCAVFFHDMSWMKSGTELSLFLRVFLPTIYSLTRVLMFCFNTEHMRKLLMAGSSQCAELYTAYSSYDILVT